MTLGRLWLGALSAALLLSASAVRAQIAMPDPKQMSGIPRPVGLDELPAGSVSVRVIRGALTNNVPNQEVELHINDGGEKVQKAKTDDQGRVQFDKLPAGASLQAVTVVDGERIESQVFPSPSANGIRLMLVATDKEKAARDAAAAAQPPVVGTVVLGGESRIIIEPGPSRQNGTSIEDEMVDIYYFFDIVNNANTPVTLAKPFTFDMPRGAAGVTLFKESSKQARVNGVHVLVNGPFMPGTTSFQLVASMPVTGPTLEIEQVLPVAWEQPAFVMKHFGKTSLSSPQFIGQQEMEGQDAVMAGANRLEAGTPLKITLSNLPHHSRAPRWTTLGIASLILVIGGWLLTRRSDPVAAKDERKRLIARREKLFQDLVRLENDYRNGKADGGRYASRREELIAALERVYGSLDTEELGPSTPTDRTGVAA